MPTFDNMTPAQLAEFIGPSASEALASVMLARLRATDYATPDDVPQAAWDRLVGECATFEPAHAGQDIAVGDRVESGDGEDHDTGRVESIDGETAFVAWDSGVKTPAAACRLRRL